MSIIFNIQDFGDNNSLQVPAMSPIDGRFAGSNYLRPISLSVSDKDIDSSKSCRFPGERKEKGILHRPVSDQRLHEPVKKEVSWHRKIPTSIQTLSCVEDTASPVDMQHLSNEDKHAQSQPILGTLESSSRNKHVCRHTFSVRQSYSSSKENRKVWNLKRSSSEEKSKVKDKCIPFSLKSVNMNSSTTTATDSNCSSSSSLLCDSRLSVLDTARDDQFSLIDWEEDEKACDAEVQDIIGNNDDEDEDDEKPTPSLPLQTSLDFGADTPVQDSKQVDSTRTSPNENIGLDSIVTVTAEPVEVIKIVNECKNTDTTASKIRHSKSADEMMGNVVILSDNYADKEHISEDTCGEKPDASNEHIRINIPLDNLSVPSPRVMNGDNLLAVPSAACDSSPYQHERRKEESHL